MNSGRKLLHICDLGLSGVFDVPHPTPENKAKTV